ncbi:MAG: hypothetical protein ACI4E1_14125 [Lachnospira sp.]
MTHFGQISKHKATLIFALLSCFVIVPLSAQQTNEQLDSIINTLELKEVTVTARKIKQSGDTISYSAATYRSNNDKTLEDLLRKMPGIEVKADGQITYNGQWINEFYIEGLDMLGENYGIAIRNIDANDIGSVQVIQNHQDAKLFQGVKSGNAPAMNIKLRQNALGIWSSTLQAAIGTQPNLSWDVSANIMNFRRTAQNISVYKTNNIGIDLRQDIGAPATFNSSYGTGILFPNSPGLNDIYTYRNNSHSLSVNQLFKLNEDETLAFNFNYLFDKEKREATEQTTYLTDSISRFVIDESNRACMRQHFIGTHAVYKLNGNERYIKNSFTASATFPKGDGAINNLIMQQFSGHSFSIDDVLSINYKKKQGGIGEATLHANYTDKYGILRLADIGTAQTVRQRDLNTNGAASIIAVAVPHFMFNLNCGFDAQWQQAKTELDLSENSTPGNQRTWHFGVNITPKFFLHYGQRFQWLIYVPAGFEYYTSTDGEWEYDKMFFSFKPYTNITYKPSERLTISLTSICEESMPTSLSLMAQSRYIDYRTSISNPYFIEAKINRTIKTALSASYSSVLDMLFGGITLTHVYSHNSLSNGYEITDDIIEYIRLPYATKDNVWQGDQTLSKGFFKWNSKISESFTIGTSENEFYVDDVMHRGRSNYLRARIAFNASFASWITFDTSNEYSMSKTYTDRIPNGSAKHAFTNATSFVFRPFKQLSLTPSVMYYYNDYSTNYRNNAFLNCDMEYSIGNTIFSIKCSNLLDSRIFRRFNDNGIIQYSSQYRLRGRTIMLGVRFSIK